MSRPGDELTELLWDNGPALRTTTPASPLHFPPFQPFTCSAAGSSRAHELDKRHGVSVVGAIMDDDDVGLPVHHRHVEEDDAVPWLHCPGIDDGDSDTAPLPPEYCESLLSSGYSALHAVPEAAEPAAAPCAARPLSSNGGGAAVVVDVPATQPQLSGAVSAGESIMNFSFFSRPLQRPAQASTASPSNLLESTVGQQTAASRLRNTPLFSEQRMAWLQPPNKAPRPPAAAVAAPAPHASPAATDPCRPHQHAEAAAAAVTTSSVCSANGDRSQSHAKRSSEQHAAECSVSQDEDVDDEPGAARRSAGRGTKRSRTAEVHNLSERRRRDRINEKMRALQELIPNCNKVDKASMLEEAIEYLKTLQLQVQMMSMGAGLCVPPPPAAMLMQMQMPVAAAYPYLGMGLGFGMGAAAFDMRFAGAPQFPGMPPAMAMPVPHGPAMFGMPPGGQAIMPPFAHVMNGGGAAPAEQRENAAAVPAPGGAAAGADARPPVPVAPQGDQKQQT